MVSEEFPGYDDPYWLAWANPGFVLTDEPPLDESVAHRIVPWPRKWARHMRELEISIRSGASARVTSIEDLLG